MCQFVELQQYRLRRREFVMESRRGTAANRKLAQIIPRRWEDGHRIGYIKGPPHNSAPVPLTRVRFLILSFVRKAGRHSKRRGSRSLILQNVRVNTNEQKTMALAMPKL